MGLQHCQTIGPGLPPGTVPSPSTVEEAPPSAELLSPALRTGAVVLAATAVALFGRLLLSSILHDDSAFLSCIVAVILSSWYGGFRAGLVATALNAAAAWYLFLRPFHLSSEQSLGYAVQLVLFVLIGVTVSAVNEAWHQTRKRLLAQEGFLSTILESTPTGVLVLDAQGFVTFANSAAANIFGLGSGLLTGRDCQEIGLLPKHVAGAAALTLQGVLDSEGMSNGIRLVVEDAASARIEVQARVTRLPAAERGSGTVVISLVPVEAEGGSDV